MSVELTDGVEWINPCTRVDSGHMHVSVFVLGGTDGPVLIDTGSVVHTDVVERALDGRAGSESVHTILLTHTDLPHVGNLPRFVSRWPDADVVVGTGHPELQGLPDRTKESVIGERETISGRTFEFIDPPLADRSLTNWIFDHDSGVLFTSDGLGSYHADTECGLTSPDVTFSVQGIYEYHKTALPWLRYVEPGVIREVLESMFDAYDVTYLAPSHGPPIARGDVDRFVAAFERAIVRIAGEYTVAGHDA